MDEVAEDRIINRVSESEIVANLRKLVSDSRFLCEPTIRGGQAIPFVDHHINYLITHPLIEPSDYLSNLRLKLRK